MDYFADKHFEREFIHNIPNAETLLRKELLLIQSEETLLEERIRVMKNFANNLSSADPQYGMIRLALEMDQIDLDEHHIRKESLLQKLGEMRKL